jgi:hypothetical protein
VVLVSLAVYALVMPRMKDYSYVALLPVAWFVLSGPQAITASLAVLAVLIPRPLPQLKLWLPMVPQPYVYAPLLGALVLWSILTTIPGVQAGAPADADDTLARPSAERVAAIAG